MQENVEKAINDYKGLPLFNDVGDYNLRARNRGAIMANTLEEHLQGNKVNNTGLGLILGYFNSLPSFERQSCKTAFEEQLTQRGINFDSSNPKS